MEKELICKLGLSLKEHHDYLKGKNSGDKVIVDQMLKKLSYFFIEMTQFCLTQLPPDQVIQFQQKIDNNKLNLEIIQNRQISNKLNLEKQAKKQTNHDDDNSSKKKKRKKKVEQTQLYSELKEKKPKHPISSFFFFFQEKSKDIAKDNGEVVGSKIAKLVASSWKEMTELQRSPYQMKSRETREKYEEEMVKFKEVYGDQMEEIKKHKKSMKKQKN